MEEQVQILPVNPETFETQEYDLSDQQLLTVSELDTVFSSSTDYIEICVYDENQNKIYATPEGEVLTTYNVKEGDVLLNPQQDLERLGFDIDAYFINYNFYRKRLNSDSTQKYFISQVSSDRTEIALDSNDIELDQILSSSAEFIQFREDATYFVDFYLNFGSNQSVIANNIKIDDEQVLIKLYEPLPSEFDTKSTLWIVEEISTPQAYQVIFPFTPEIPDDFTFISGPNLNLNIQGEVGESSQDFSYNTLINSDTTSSINQIQSLLEEKQININVNYENFSEFVHFSSAQTRLENFYYKVGLIESASNQLSDFLGQVTSNTISTSAFSSSKAQLTSQISTIIKNFDGYEYFLYFNSGSQFSYPKSNTEPPYTLYSTGSTEVLNWIGSADPGSIYYGGIALSASNFDQENQDWLYFSIPEYLRTDPDNLKYELFVDMVGQHYDNIWVYTKDITNKFDADNRLNYGISKDLVADAIKDFGVKLYSNNFNTNDLYTAFLGLTPSGSLFPFPEITGSLPADTGFEYVDTRISASNDVIPLDDVNKRLYKRIYHNIPYLLKTKGTIAGLKALITSYGIPDTILRVNEFGGKDRNNTQDWDYWQNLFNFRYDTYTGGYGSVPYGDALYGSPAGTIDTDWNLNTDWGASGNVPHSVQFRFKSKKFDSNNLLRSQSVWSLDDGSDVRLVLESPGDPTSGSYSGSISDPEKEYAHLKFFPDYTTTPETSASVFLPFRNGDWWSVMITNNGDDFELYAANKIYNGDSGNQIGFIESSSVTISSAEGNWTGSGDSHFPADTTLSGYDNLSGSFQEIRYFTEEMSDYVFRDYVMNPSSIEGLTHSSSAEQLAFRASLGGELYTGSVSIHPKVTGSASNVTSSFASNSNFSISSGAFTPSKEIFFYDQSIAGIKNRVSDKITTNDLILPSGDTLSPMISIQQTSYESSSYTPDINYLEVAFSPQNQINDDINSQLGYFNIGEYIGDPRQISSSARSYPDLDRLRDSYFEKYIKSYDVVDFIRLIKFFDNSLFKMIKDFTPARTSLSSGVVVKQHILERNKVRPPQVSYEDVTYTGSIKPQSRDYNTGSGNVGAYEFESGSSIYRFSGGTGGSFERFNGLKSSPSASDYGLSNKFYLTQSYSESIEFSVADRINNSGSFVGYRDILVSDQKEFYDGEFSGSNLEVTDLIANPDCGPYLKVSDEAIFFNPIFFSLTPGDDFQGTTTSPEILKNVNNPSSGDAWIISSQIGTTLTSSVQFIRLSNNDSNGVFVGEYLDDGTILKLVLPDANVKDNSGVVDYKIDGITRYASSTILRISQTEGDNISSVDSEGNHFYPITSSENGGSENWSLSASGNFTSSDSLAQCADNLQQGNFKNGVTSVQTQYFWHYNGDINDEQGFFNTGSEDVNLSDILSNEIYYPNGSYNPQRTSNIPWFFSASIAYSSSDLGTGNEITSSNFVYHSASCYGGLGSTNQDFCLTASDGSPSGIYAPSPKFGPSAGDANTIFTEYIGGDFYNPLIPGNSGSDSGVIGGHPKIKLAGTASLNFEFQFLCIGGTKRTLAPDQVYYSPFSGSSLCAGNCDFIDPDDLFVGELQNSICYSGSSRTCDGSFCIRTTGLKDYICNNYDNTVCNVCQYDHCMFYTIYSDEPFTASVEYAQFSESGDYQGPFSREAAEFCSVSGGGQHTATVDHEVALGSDYTRDDDGYITRLVVAGNSGNPPASGMCYAICDVCGYFPNVYYDTTSDSGLSNRVPLSACGDAYNSSTVGSNDAFQGTSCQLFDIDVVGDAYPTVDIQAHLKRTGSGIPVGGYIITSSTKFNSEIFGGQVFPFADCDASSGYICDIHEPDPSVTESTVNNIDDMYFVEYSMSNYTATSTTDPEEEFEVQFLEEDGEEEYTKIFLEQRALSVEGDFNLTGSIIIKRSTDDNPSSLGDNVLFSNFIIDSDAEVGRADAAGSFTYPFGFDDAFRMGISVEKSFGAGLTITEYTMSIFPSSSIYAPLDSPPVYDLYKEPTSTGIIIPTYFGANILPFALALDCQPLLNNYNDIRKNSFIMDVDYTNITGSVTPVNQAQLLDFSAVKASIPDSNYTSLKSINPRYNGVKTTSNQINVWTSKDTNTYGQNPVIELRDAYFGYFKSIKDLYPLVNDKTSLELTYLLDEQSNAIPPSLEEYGANVLKSTFPTTNEVTLGFISSSELSQELDDSYPIFKLTQQATPVFYSQTSSAGYATEIPLTGSGRISMYDNNDSTSFVDYTFTAQGTASWADDEGTNVGHGQYTQVINPTEDKTTNPYGAGTYVNPYSTNNGVMTFSDDSDKTVESNPQTISMQTSFATSFLYESGTTELRVDVQMLSGSTGVLFDLEDVSLKVYRTGKDPVDLGSIIGTVGGGTEDVLRFVGDRIITQRRGLFRRTKRGNKISQQKLFNNERGSFYFVVENYAMNRFLNQKGVYTRGKGGSQQNGDITGLEFVIKANSGNFLLKDDDEIKFQVKIDLPRSKQKFANILFPSDYTGPIFPAKVSTIGERTQLLAGDNIGAAPFWVYTGSAGGGSNIIDQSILVMSSSNINEAYGGAFYQGPLPYVPGSTEYFDSGVEPVGTQFPKILSPIEFIPGDEIRFGNNENHSYEILEVTPPEANIESGNAGRIKIKLDGEVPQSINKDFFLIRRYQPKASSFIIDAPFPYSAESSGSNANGIIYPTFPTKFIQSSGSSIVTDLISKGVIT